MLQWYEPLIVIGYELGVLLAALILTRLAGRDKDAEISFDGLYFLTRWALPFALLSQFGLVALVCGLFWTRQSLAVMLTALIGIPGVMLIGAIVQNRFVRRYHRLSNLLRRLERLGPAQRAELLESLPPHLLHQIPGDYRIISWEQDKKL